MLGTQLKERYHLQEELGRGGMAVVYRAKDTVLRRDVAVKILHPHLADRRAARLRLHREALAAAKLSHENILKVFDFSSEDEAGPAFLVTEYVRGHTLRALLEHKDLPAEAAALVGYVLAEALALAHEHNIVHRDVKPENVMFRSDDGTLKLMDFGIAKLFDEQELTVTQGLLGSPAHMAPEVIEGKPASYQSDLFSLGTVLYLLATGEYPFWGTNPHALLKQIGAGRFKAPESHNPAIGRRLGGIIKRMMAHDPAARYATAGAVAAELKTFLAEVGIDDPPRALQALLRDLEKEGPALKARVTRALLDRAREAARAGRKGEILSHLNRVLAYDPGNTEAEALLAELSRRPWWIYAAAGLGGVALLGGGGLALSYGLAEEPPPASAPVSRPTVAASPSSNIFLPELLANPGLGEPSTAPASEPVAPTSVPVRPASVPSSGPASAPASAPLKLAGITLPGRPITAPAPAPKIARAKAVRLRTDFWMSLTVDGAKDGTVTGSRLLTLSAGRHELVLENPGCKPLRYEVEVQDTGGAEPLLLVNGSPAPSIDAVCDWRSAILQVKSLPADARIKVYGDKDRFIGSLRDGKVSIPMTDSKATMALSFVNDRGQVQSHLLTLEAGQLVPLSLSFPEEE